MRIQHFSPTLPTFCLVTGFFLLGNLAVAADQESIPFICTTGKETELVGFPIHQPCLDSGPVTAVSGTLITWSPAFKERPFGTSLPLGEECYAEVVGPSNHPWLGHRFEIDENATRIRSDHGLVATASPYNTRGLPNVSLVGASLEIRPHLSVNGLWGEAVRNRIVYGGEKASSFGFSFSDADAPTGTRSVFALWPNPTGNLQWIDSLSTGTPFTRPILLPPGTSVAITFGEKRGSALGLSGVARSWPTASPLRAGANFLAYPYPQDMRLGVDWGTSREGFLGSIKPSPTQERIEFFTGGRRGPSYMPEIQANGSLRWRLLDSRSPTPAWLLPALYLDQIPAGQGFILFKTKANPNHLFFPPKP